jgi:5'(3')-deoxyribonucleotidase
VNILNVLGAAKTFALDFDSVLADTMVIWVKEYNERYHADLTKNDIYAWDISKILPISIEEISNLFNYVWEYRWEEIPPCEPSQNGIIESIHKGGFRISILTKRERPTVSYVARWLDHHGIFSDDLIFIYDSISKSEYPFDFLLDDSPTNLIDITAPKVGLLFDQPWNKDFQWPLRIKSLREAASMVVRNE